LDGGSVSPLTLARISETADRVREFRSVPRRLLLSRNHSEKSLIRPSTAVRERARVLPLSDGLPARRFPIVNVSLIVANFAVWLFYELPHLNSSIYHASFYACTVNGSCHGPEPWGISWFTAMFMHASWDHILGNMLFLAVFGKNVESAFGHVRYLAFYVAGGFVATATQAAMTLLAGTAADARVPNLGASGAIAAVLGAFFVLYPNSKVFGLLVIFPIRVSAWFFLGFWFLYQLFEANFGLLRPDSGGGTAFFAHVGGFLFGVVIARLLVAAGRTDTETDPSVVRVPI
jgi:rhomboid family protein